MEAARLGSFGLLDRLVFAGAIGALRLCSVLEQSRWA
jgi:hypothetical protein